VSAGQETETGKFAGLSLLLPDRELRVTLRCLLDDLNAPQESTLKDVEGHPVVRAFLRERREKTTGTRQVNNVRSGKEVWVLTQGERHRGGTWFEAERNIVWLVAAGHHESGSKDDFFPYCQRLDEEGLLAPSKEDYKALLLAENERLAARILIEAPLLRKRAREADGEVSAEIGGRFGVRVSIEVVDDIEEMSVAFDLRTLQKRQVIPVILAALEATGEWDEVDRMPTRVLEPYERAYSHMGIAG